MIGLLLTVCARGQIVNLVFSSGEPACFRCFSHRSANRIHHLIGAVGLGMEPSSLKLDDEAFMDGSAAEHRIRVRR